MAERDEVRMTDMEGCTCSVAPPHDGGCPAYQAFKRSELVRSRFIPATDMEGDMELRAAAKRVVEQGRLGHPSDAALDGLRVALAATPSAAPELEVEERRDAFGEIRLALKGARGLALDNDETTLDAELGRAIDLLDWLSSDARLAVPELDVNGLSRGEDGRLHCEGCDGHDIDLKEKKDAM